MHLYGGRVKAKAVIVRRVIFCEKMYGFCTTKRKSNCTAHVATVPAERRWRQTGT